MLINTAANPVARIVLAHGAGAGMDHPFMQTIAEGLAAENIEVVRFNFPYMVKRGEDGRKRPPDRQPKLLASFAEIIAAQDDSLPLYIAGKSMGGRMATLLQAEQQLPAIKGILCLGYPFHAPGKTEQWRAEHFPELSCPTLIIQGERDSFGNREEIAAHRLPENISTLFMPDGDHSLKPRKKSGHSEAENLKNTVKAMAAFIKER